MTTERLPRDPIAAVTHRHPYSFYAELATQRPLYRDEERGMWVAASAEAVTTVLSDSNCRVRPATEPVPEALIGSPSGAIFAALVRMNDGAAHCPLKRAVSAALATVDLARAGALATQAARALAAGRSLHDFIFHLPVHVVAGLVGVPESRLNDVAIRVDAFVRCIAPGASAEQIEHGSCAAADLLDLFGDLAAQGNGVVAALTVEAKRAGIERPDAAAANAIGFLSQTYEATAGLIGNTIVALARDPSLRAQAAEDTDLLRGIVAEVARHDPPVQNTRRFLAKDAVIAGQPMKAGDVVLVVLAAGNRDRAANPDPARFDPSRADRRSFTFGLGRHACPGEALATAIAAAGLRELLAAKPDALPQAEGITYRPSANTRIPLFERTQM